MSDSSTGIIASITLLIQVLIVVAMFVALWKIFEKADKPGWAALIPIYNTWVFCEILWPKQKVLYFVLFLIPFVNVVIGILSVFRLAKAFDKGIGFALGLLFLYPIFILILGFSDSTYQGEALQ